MLMLIKIYKLTSEQIIIITIISLLIFTIVTRFLATSPQVD